MAYQVFMSTMIMSHNAGCSKDMVKATVGYDNLARARGKNNTSGDLGGMYHKANSDEC